MQDDPRVLIPDLLRQFYQNGWATGSGGGLSIRQGDRIYMAPSGVQKELVTADDLFVNDLNGKDLHVPSPERKLKKSQCYPLFMAAYRLRDAGAVIHSHSKWANLVTLFFPAKEFKISHQEMLKGILNPKLGRNYQFHEILVVPVVENTPEEYDLKDHIEEAMVRYPETNAILVRRHGFYVWGPTWQKTKTMCECYDYLFELACHMKQHGMDPCLTPEEYELKFQAVHNQKTALQ
ncbi:unnamed protein product [Darwinula stevensoni]|uniref:Probable methylthioribulose-1-phosphate dehydratase n=1 Tax=Darwinula stevensoni TaxID=69355 RepID=A0A7R9FS27_9CRUS|nr:unnamed protein product [Darwinula stevensoni]CAG0902920.1 unnamed protein product [Darwinula stevensoni]